MLLVAQRVIQADRSGMLSSPKDSAKIKAVSTKYLLSASVGHTVADELFSFLTDDIRRTKLCDVMFAFSHAHQQSVLVFTHLPAICACTNAEQFRPQITTREN